MSLKDRVRAIGGAAGAEKYFQVVAHHLAHIMGDDNLRGILHSIVPKVDEGEIHLAQIALEYPNFLTGLSSGFKDAVSDKAIGGDLSSIIQNVESDSEAVLKAVKALVDLEISIVAPKGQEWDPTQTIPIFYIPVNDTEATVMEGVDSNLERVTIPYQDFTAPYVFLLLNFDEESPVMDKHEGYDGVTVSANTFLQDPKAVWQDFLSSISLTSPAYAHSPENHDPCYHNDIIQPVKRITIHKDHEPGPNKPEIMLSIRLASSVRDTTYDLEDVDNENEPYTNYNSLRTWHGTCGSNVVLIRVWEDDVIDDDMVCQWEDEYLTGGWGNTLTPAMATSYDKDATLVIRKTTEQADP